METEHGSVKHRGKHRALLQHGPPPPPPSLDTSSLLWSTAARLPRSSLTEGGGGSLEASTEYLPSGEQMWAGMGMEKRNGGKRGSVATSPTPDGAAIPQIQSRCPPPGREIGSSSETAVVPSSIQREQVYPSHTHHCFMEKSQPKVIFPSGH